MITVLSNITISGPWFRKTLHKISGEEINIPDGYNTWAQELVNPDQTLLTSDAVFLILDGAELLGRISPREADYIQSLYPYISLLEQFVTSHRDVPLFVSTLDIPQRQPLPLIGRRSELHAMAYWRAQLEKLQIPIFELAEIAADIGRNQFYSSKMWYFGSIPFSMAGEKALAAECHRCWNALQGKRKKCLVLDLDNTLWGGVIGEDGLGGIVLGPTKEGAIYQDFQRFIYELKRQGVLLTIVSKNNREDALKGIKQHPDMILREEDFVSIKANWDPKPTNIATIAQELNIGLDSLVFIDDNPIERAAVKMTLPQVVVPEFPSNPILLDSFIRDIARDYFPTLRLTSEDIKKSEQYRIEQLRIEEKHKFSNLDDYLASLDMRLKIYEIGETDIARTAQLTQKTNQFNLTTRRYTETDIRSMAQSTNWKLWLGELEDRFGQYGKIILCFVKIDGEIGYVDTFLMSCRVMGRGVETAFLHFIEQKLADIGIKKIKAKFIATQKNSIVKNFWKEHQYTMQEDTDTESAFCKNISSQKVDSSTNNIIQIL